jgi:hypothetical protein
MILLTVTLARYTQWHGTTYGNWLAKKAEDPYVDLVPSVVFTGLVRQLGDWWNKSFKELTSHVLSRYVIQQHQSMSFEKTWTGERCLLQVDGSKIVSTSDYNKIGMGNARLRSSLQILSDLGLIERDEDGIRFLTSEGKTFLKRELTKEASNEVP